MPVRGYYPAFLDLRGRRCLVVGGGSVAERKIASLQECGARVVVVSPQFTGLLEEWATQGRLELRRRSYQSGDLDGIWLAIAATDSVEANQEVYAEATRRDLLVNVVDDPQHCNFIVPAVVRRGNLVLAVSTGGKSPALARRVREELEHVFPEEYADHLEQMVSLRARLRQALPNAAGREDAWRRLMAGGLLDLLRDGRSGEVEELVQAIIRETRMD